WRLKIQLHGSKNGQEGNAKTHGLSVVFYKPGGRLLHFKAAWKTAGLLAFCIRNFRSSSQMPFSASAAPLHQRSRGHGPGTVRGVSSALFREQPEQIRSNETNTMRLRIRFGYSTALPVIVFSES